MFEMYAWILKICKQLPDILSFIERLNNSNTEVVLILLSFGVIMMSMSYVACLTLDSPMMRLIEYGAGTVSTVILAFAIPAAIIRLDRHINKWKRKRLLVKKRLAKQRKTPKLE